MQVQSNTELASFHGWTLRLRPASQNPARLLMLVHGWTGDENSMWVFARSLKPAYWIVAPRAPYPTEPGGYSWRPRQLGGHRPPTFEDLRPAVDALLTLVDDFAADRGLGAAQFDAMGFSQGAALIVALALLHPERLGRAAVLAGFVPEGADSLVVAHPLDGKPFFVAHGTADERVPVEHARRAVGQLEQAGAQVTYCEDDVGHKLSLKCLRGLEAFFA